MKKILLTFTCFLFVISTPVMSKEMSYGIGSTLAFTDSDLYLPIHTENYIFEPTFFTKTVRQSSTVSLPGLTEIDESRFGLGIFIKSKLSEKSIFYYGARLVYFQKREVKTYYVPFSPNTYSDTATTGRIFEPTLGIEYSMSPEFSVGINAGFQFIEESGTTIPDNQQSTINGEYTDETTLTAVKVILRYYYK